MKNYKRIALGSIAAASLAMSGAAIAGADVAAPVQDGVQLDVAGANVMGVSTIVKADAAQGTFAWSQGTVTPNAQIKGQFQGSVKALCSSTISLTTVNPLQWQITVSGDVQNSFTATIDQLAQEESVQQNMTCSCGSNPADGKAIIEAEVKGVPVTYLIEQAAPVAGANTVTFVCSDGTTQSMPLAYVIGRHAVLCYEVNGEDLSASVGGNNQLWLARTSANYFMRDVVEIVVTCEDVVPANPGEDIEYPNSPNVGLVASSVA